MLIALPFLSFLMILSGTFVKHKGLTYLFLGYIDYKMKRFMVADRYGNKIELWTEFVTVK